MQRLAALVLAIALPITSGWAQSTAPQSPPKLSLEQQAKMADAITREAGTPVRDVHFSVAIGNAVPADVTLRPVPASVGQAAPQFRGASYVVVEEQIAIVDSQTRKILAVIQRGLNQSGSMSRETR